MVADLDNRKPLSYDCQGLRPLPTYNKTETKNFINSPNAEQGGCLVTTIYIKHFFIHILWRWLFCPANSFDLLRSTIGKVCDHCKVSLVLWQWLFCPANSFDLLRSTIGKVCDHCQGFTRTLAVAFLPCQ